MEIEKEILKALYEIGDDVDHIKRSIDDIGLRLDDIVAVLDDIREQLSYISRAKR